MGGLAEAISKMCFGNKIGFRFAKNLTEQELFSPDYSGIILELRDQSDWQEYFLKYSQFCRLYPNSTCNSGK